MLTLAKFVFGNKINTMLKQQFVLWKSIVDKNANGKHYSLDMISLLGQLTGGASIREGAPILINTVYNPGLSLD